MWEKRGKRNEFFEKEIYQTKSSAINEDYFKMTNLITVERYSHEHGEVKEINVMPIENFNDDYLNLHHMLQENIGLCHFEKPTPVQKYAIRILTDPSQNDLITVSNTGSGKLAKFLYFITSLS
uniref:RNA helicase n=2 Tax=Meloidogyne TaxID=189290 RepID=A0A6V7TUM2_MELEN|nr:unnamed protein product [Meloidogyne enterolobii]